MKKASRVSSILAIAMILIFASCGSRSGKKLEEKEQARQDSIARAEIQKSLRDSIESSRVYLFFHRKFTPAKIETTLTEEKTELCGDGHDYTCTSFKAKVFISDSLGNEYEVLFSYAADIKNEDEMKLLSEIKMDHRKITSVDADKIIVKIRKNLIYFFNTDNLSTEKHGKAGIRHDENDPFLQKKIEYMYTPNDTLYVPLYVDGAFMVEGRPKDQDEWFVIPY